MGFSVHYQGRQFIKAKSRQQSLQLNWNISNNNLGFQSYFNPTTGSWYLRSYYSGWTWQGNVSYGFSTTFGPSRRWYLDTKTYLNVFQSKSRPGVYYTTDVPDFNVPVREYCAYDMSLIEDLKLGWQNDKLSVAAIVRGSARTFFGNKEIYRTVRSLDCNYGATGTINLPRNWSIGTDVTLYTRRGYLYRQANTTDFVWNGRVAKSWLKGTLTMTLEGMDLLHQLSNITYRSTAEGRTVVVHNVVPDYVMLRVQWRFHKSPKKQ